MQNTPKEWSLIKKIKSQVQRHNSHTIIPLGDDAFVYKNFPGYTVICQDMLNEDVHFSRDYFTAADLGHKALAVNLSDMAAMGATPRFAQVSLALPKNINESWLDDFYKGMMDLADRFSVEIVGGDLCASSEKITIDVSLQGNVEQPLPRKRAQAGDLILCSGPLGLSQIGMMALQKNLPDFTAAKNKHLRPVPRIDLVPFLQTHASSISSLMDCSDGLMNDLLQLLPENLGINLDLSNIPLHEEIKRAVPIFEKKATEFILWGGEDYELLMTIPPAALSLFSDWQILGAVTNSPQVTVTAAGKTLDLKQYQGWSHFSK